MANGPSLTLSWSINIGKNTKDMKIWGKCQIAKVKWGCRFKYHGPKQEVSAQLHLLRYLFYGWQTHSKADITSKSACPKLEPCWISTQIRTVTPTRPAAQSCLDVRRWICWCLESPSISWSMMSLVERYSKAHHLLICCEKRLGIRDINQPTTGNIYVSDPKSPYFC